MTRKEIQQMQEKIGETPDGFWGPLSIKACQKYLKSLCPHNNFPKQSEVASYYGPHGESGKYTPPMKKFKLPFAVYYEDKPITELSAHTLIADSLKNVFERLAEAFPDESSRKKAGILNYDGIYNPRCMRGTKNWSMHAWAIAIDLDAGRNGLWTKWPERAYMPLEVMECFASEGWLPAGAFWLRDAMHFQATSV